MQHRPHLVATHGQAAMVVLHLREIPVATFNRRGGPLERPGVLTRPLFPARQQLGCQLPGARMPLKRFFNRLEHESNLGLLPWTACAAQLLLPVQQRQQQCFSPLCPPRGHDHLLQVLTHRLPPKIDQGRDASKLLANLVQGVLFHWQPVGLKQHVDRLESAPNCSSTSFDVWRASPQAARDAGCAPNWRGAASRHCQHPASDAPRLRRLLPGPVLVRLGHGSLGVLLQHPQALLGLFKAPFGLPQATEDGQRIALGQVMAQVKQVRDAQAAQPRVGQLDQRLGSVTHQVQHLGAKRREAFVGTVVPGGKTAIRRHLFHQQRPRGQVHEHQPHPLQKNFVHRPDDRSYLAMGNPFFLPGCGGLQDEAFQRVHDASQGAGRAPHLCLQMETAEKLADRLGSHASFEAKYTQGGHDQADKPGVACLRFPKRRLWGAISAVDHLEMAMHAAFGKADSIRQAPDALFAVLTNRVENDSSSWPTIPWCRSVL